MVMGDAGGLPKEIAIQQFAKDHSVDLGQLQDEHDKAEQEERDVTKITSPLADEDLDVEIDDDDLPSSGVMPYLAVACIPCVGMAAINKRKEVKTLYSHGEVTLAVNAAKVSAHLGFLGVVFGTMIWMVAFGLGIKPLLEGDPPCEGYPDCVPDEWMEHTLAGSPPE